METPTPVEVPLVFDEPITIDLIEEALQRLAQQFREES